MKQLIQNVSTGEASVVEVPAPRPGNGELLVRVGASLISAGTERMAVEFAGKNLLQKALARPDLVRQVIDKASREGILSAVAAARQRLDSDLSLGYSNAGTVIDVGPNVSGFAIGEKVACAGAGYASHAEVVRVPRNLVAKVPARIGGRPDIDFEEAAFTTVGAIALQGFRLAAPQLGETVAVIGLGLIGLLTVQLASAAGCRVVGMDVNGERCRLAHELGCAATAQTDEELKGDVLTHSAGAGADAVIICASTSSDGPVQAAGEIARQRARVIAVGAVGLGIPRKTYYEKELSVYVSRSYGPGRYDPEYEEKGHDYPIGYVRWTENRNMHAFLQLLADDRVNVRRLITHRFGIEQADKAYDLITGKTGEPSLGVVITYAATSSLAHRFELVSTPVPRGAGAERVVVGMLGAGNFATAVLLPAMKAAEKVEFAGLVTASGVTASAAGKRFGFRYCATDERELLQDPAINTIVIATRHHLHARQIVAALGAGKHVFCEKPLCISESELDEIVRAYRAVCTGGSGPQLMVGFNRRFSPMGLRLHSFVRASADPIVAHYRINAGFLPATHWTQDLEQGGGRIIGENCHFVDFLRWLTGHRATAVRCVGLPNLGRYCNDNISATLEFENGAVATITYVANGDKRFAKEKLEVFGGDGAAVLDDFRSLIMVRRRRRQIFRSRLRQNKGHRGEWEAFAQAICRGEAAPIPFDQLVNVTQATLAMRRSLMTGERITLP